MTRENDTQRTTLRIAGSAAPDVVSFEGSLALKTLGVAREWTSNDADALEYARSVVRSEGDAILRLVDALDSRFCEAVSLVLDCRGRLVTTGMGKAGLIARKIAATASSTGSPSHFVHPGEARHGDLGAITADDVVLAFSYSGETEEIKQILGPLASRGVPIVAIVSTADSALGRAATVALEIGKIEEADSLKLAPSSSAAAMLAMGDALRRLCAIPSRRRAWAESKPGVRTHASARIVPRRARYDDGARRLHVVPKTGTSFRRGAASRRIGTTLGYLY